MGSFIDWRYDDQTASKIANISIRLGNDICCLGTPSVYRELINSNKNIFLIDKNPFICDFFRNYNAEKIINIDVMSINSIIRKYDVIIMDPPWYLSYIRSWLSKALDMIKEVEFSFFKKNDADIILFGSRARGDYSRISDIDIAIKFKNNTIDKKKKFVLLKDKLENLNIPYKIDLLDLDKVSLEMKEIILKEGIVLKPKKRWFLWNKN